MRPERRDWEFIFSNPKDYPLSKGDGRIAVHLAGEEVASTYRFIHIPEEWERREVDRGTQTSIVRIVSIVPLVLILRLFIVLSLHLKILVVE